MLYIFLTTSPFLFLDSRIVSLNVYGTLYMYWMLWVPSANNTCMYHNLLSYVLIRPPPPPPFLLLWHKQIIPSLLLNDADNLFLYCSCLSAGALWFLMNSMECLLIGPPTEQLIQIRQGEWKVGVKDTRDEPSDGWRTSDSICCNKNQADSQCQQPRGTL